MKARQLWFLEPGSVEVRKVELPKLAEDDVLIRSKYSGISAGTEMLAYRGLLPKNVPLDANISSMKGADTAYPFQYGYACVGFVEQVGNAVDKSLLSKKVFAFNPHASHFISKVDELIFLPDEVSDLGGVFVANMETAMSLLIDGAPKADENVVVLGLGIVGLLLSALLQTLTLKQLYLVDGIAKRRETAMAGTSSVSFAPNSSQFQKALPAEGVNLVYELSGNPETLNSAIDICGFAGRIIVGSWYGDKSVPVELGGKFHRNRLKIISSQVSTISPEHLQQWSKEKRLRKALDAIITLQPEKLVSHQFGFSEAKKAYALLDRAPQEALQIVFNYED